MLSPRSYAAGLCFEPVPGAGSVQSLYSWLSNILARTRVGSPVVRIRSSRALSHAASGSHDPGTNDTVWSGLLLALV
jgi:hypothetical protein